MKKRETGKERMKEGRGQGKEWGRNRRGESR